MTALTIAAGVVIVGFAGLLGLTILVFIWQGKIPLFKLLSEPNGDASLSRLQFLIFTFVIALSFFLIVVGNQQPAFPSPIPAEVLTLLGISASSYLVSKGIQFSSPAGVARQALVVSPATVGPPVPAVPVPLTVSILNAPAGTAMPAITWSLDAPAEGTLQTTGPNLPVNGAIWTPPAAAPVAGTKVTIRAQAAGLEDGLAVIIFSSPGGVARQALVVSPATVGPPAGAPVPLTVSILNAPAGAAMPAITWSLDAPAEGTLQTTGLNVPANGALWIPPAAAPAGGTKVTIRAQAAGLDDGLAVVTF